MAKAIFGKFSLPPSDLKCKISKNPIYTFDQIAYDSYESAA